MRLRKVVLIQPARQALWAVASCWSTRNRQPPKGLASLDAAVRSDRGQQATPLVLGILMLANQRTRVVAGGSDRRLLVPQHEAGITTGYRAWRTQDISGASCWRVLRVCSQITCTFDSPTLGALRRCKSLVQQSCTARFAPRIASQIRRKNVQPIHEQALSQLPSRPITLCYL